MTDEEEAIKELMEMSREQLDLVPFDTLKWICAFKKCNCHTKIRDYGLSNLQSKDIQIEMSRPERSGILTPIDGEEEGEKYFILVMPLKLN